MELNNKFLNDGQNARLKFYFKKKIEREESYLNFSIEFLKQT